MRTFFALFIVLSVHVVHHAAYAQRPPLNPRPPEASQFDFLVGEWTVDVTSKASSTPPRYQGEWYAWKALNGLGIVDEYIIHDDSNRVVYSGTTLRAFDTKSSTWTMRYIDQVGGVTGRWSEIVGSKVGAEMQVEQRGPLPNGQISILKIRYFNIQPNHFSWAADLSTDGGTTWLHDYLRIEATRRAAKTSLRDNDSRDAVGAPCVSIRQNGS